MNDEDLFVLWSHVLTKLLLVIAGALVTLPQHLPNLCAWTRLC